MAGRQNAERLPVSPDDLVFATRIPRPPCDQYVELLTCFENFCPDHAIERLLPDGAVTIIIDLDNGPKHTYDNLTLKPRQRYRIAWISGMQREFISIGAEQHSSMMVIRLRPGAGYALLGLPIDGLQDQVVDADSVVGIEIARLRQRLLDTDNMNARFALVEAWLSSRIAQGRPTLPVVEFAIARIRDNPSLLSLDAIAERTGYSHKHMIHLFKKHVGLTPKAYQRIIRFNQVLAEIESRQQVNWIALAQDCGYFDHAHFIREFRRFSGFSPRQFQRLRGEYINYIPVA